MNQNKRIIFVHFLGDGVQIRHCTWFEVSKRNPFRMTTFGIQAAAVNNQIAKMTQGFSSVDARRG